MPTIYFVTVSGSRMKDVECEKCGNTFYYLLTRASTVGRTANIFTTEYDSRKDSQKDATANLNEALRHDHDVVPCPTCQHVQEFLVQQERARRTAPYRTAFVLTGIVSLTSGAYGTFLLVMARWVRNERHFGDIFPFVCLLAAMGCFIGFLYAGLKWWTGYRFDPNNNPRDFPRGLTTNKPMTRQQFEDTLRRQALDAIAVLGRPIPFNDEGGLRGWTAALETVRLAAKFLNDPNLVGWTKVEPSFAARPQAPEAVGPNPFQFT